MASVRKEVQRVVNAALAQGWEADDRGSKVVLFAPDAKEHGDAALDSVRPSLARERLPRPPSRRIHQEADEEGEGELSG
jgi:hypothetical protein